MCTVKVTIALPFRLHLNNRIRISYNEVCKDLIVPELRDQKIQIVFSHIQAPSIDNSDWSHERTTVTITVKTSTQLSGDSVNTFAVRNCLEILNKIIMSYQATTGQWANSGYIVPLGTSDLQLFADIRVNGEDIRERWPGHSIYIYSLQKAKIKEFRSYLTGQRDLPLSKLFHINAILSLERGQYSLSVLQAATAIELQFTQAISKRLKARGWPIEAIEPFQSLTLGQKLRITKKDPRSLEFHFGRVDGFSQLFKQLDNKLRVLRNKVAHNGFLASQPDAKSAVELVNKFLNTVN